MHTRNQHGKQMARCKIFAKDSCSAMLTPRWCWFGGVLASWSVAQLQHLPNAHRDVPALGSADFLIQAGAESLFPPAPCHLTVIKGDRVNTFQVLIMYLMQSIAQGSCRLCHSIEQKYVTQQVIFTAESSRYFQVTCIIVKPSKCCSANPKIINPFYRVYPFQRV